MAGIALLQGSRRSESGDQFVPKKVGYLDMQEVGERYVYRNPLALPPVSFADIIDNSAEGVYVEPPGENRIYRLKPPAFHDDPDGARIFNSFDEQDIVSPPEFTISLRDATISGFRTVSSPHGFLPTIPVR